MIPSISWKNIWRNKARSLVVIIAITLGLFGGLFSGAIFKGMSERRVKEAIGKETSHIQIHQPKYLENPEILFSIKDAENIIDYVESLPGVKAATSRMKTTAMINSSSSSSGVNVLGIDPLKEKEVSELYTALYDSIQIIDKLGITESDAIQTFLTDSVGSYFQTKSRNPIFIGEKLAEKLKIKVRSKIVLTFQGTDGSLTGGAFRVCGIFRTENSLFEEMNAFVLNNDLERLSAFPDNEAHEIAVLISDNGVLDSTIESLQAKYPDLEVNSWKELQPDVAMLNDMMDVTMIIIIVIILLALGFGIVNTMLMVVMERVKELGMLMAVGMNKLRVFSMIILESVLLCLTGAVMGMFISVVFVEIFRTHGIDLTIFMEEGFEALGFGAVLYPTLSIDFYLEVTFLVIFTGVVASIYPAWKAMKLNPADALRTE